MCRPDKHAGDHQAVHRARCLMGCDSYSVFRTYAAQDPKDDDPDTTARWLTEHFMDTGRVPEYVLDWLIDLLSGRVRKIRVA